MDRTVLEQEAAALTELRERSRQFPLYYYIPNDKTVPFHASHKRIRILSGGNRSGKTEANCAEAAAYALGYRPWVLREKNLPTPEKPWLRPDDLPADAICYNLLGVRVPVPNTIFMVTGQSMKKGIGETIFPKLQKLLGGFITDTHMAHSGVPADLTLKNGSRIVFGSAEQGAQAFESTNYTYTSIDEPIPRRVYTGVSRGSIDQAAPIAMTFTPIGPWAGWIFKDFYGPAIHNKNHPQIDVFQISIFDNRFLSREAIEAFVNDPALSEMEKEARLFGKFMHLADTIYSNFDERVHVIPSCYIPRDWYIGMAVDPHTVKPWAIVYFAVSPIGDIYIFKEWPDIDYTRCRKDTRNIEGYANLIRQLDGELPIQTRLIDPNYGPRKDVMRGVVIPSIVSDMAPYGLSFHYKLNDDLAYGEARVRQLLHFNPDRPVDSLNRPHLFITENCPNTIQALSMYTALPRVNSDGEMDEQRRDPTYKDFADVIRYIAVSHVTSSAPEALALELFSDSPINRGEGYGDEYIY